MRFKISKTCKILFTVLLFLIVGTKSFATQEETARVCYVADTITGRPFMPIEHIEYLKPEIFWGAVPMDWEHKGEYESEKN